jgi:hypothetical protein
MLWFTLLTLVLVAVVVLHLRRRRQDEYVDFPSDAEIRAALLALPCHYVSGATSQKVSGNHAINIYPHKPSSTSPTYITPDGSTFEWLDITGYEWVAIIACNHTLTGNGLTELDLYAADDSSGTNPVAVVASGALTGTTVPKGAFIEALQTQVREVGDANGSKPKYITARITVANSSDQLSVCVIRGNAIRPQLGLTAATF